MVMNTGYSRCVSWAKELFSVIDPDEKAGSGFIQQSQTIFRCGSKKCGLIEISQLGYRRAMMSSSKQSVFKQDQIHDCHFI